MTVPSGAMKHLASTAALVLCAMSAALAQSVVSNSARQSPITRSVAHDLRTGSELVRVDVRVTDDQGRPITDLRPGEVKLEEEGAARPIVLFQHIEAPLGTYTEAAQRTIGAEVSTNQGAPQGHIYVLVFDEVHIRSGHEQKARLAAESFFVRTFEPAIVWRSMHCQAQDRRSPSRQTSAACSASCRQSVAPPTRAAAASWPR